MEQSLNEFEKARESFVKKQPQNNKDILELASYTIDRLIEGPKKTPEDKGSGFSAWDARLLIEKEAMLSSLIYKLLQLKAEYESRADWLKTQLGGEEQDIYQNVIKDNKKVTVDAFKRQLSQIQKEGIQKIILLRNEAKNADAFVQCIDKFCLAITHRLKEIKSK